MSSHYGKSGADKEVEKIQECREIVKRIVEFGVDDSQILNIIHFLALNLEEHNIMLEITGLIKSLEKKTLIIDNTEE